MIVFSVLFKTYYILWVHIRPAEAVLASTHNLCFGAKIRKLGIPLRTPVLLYIKVGFKGLFFSRTCFPDVKSITFTLPCWKTYNTAAFSAITYFNLYFPVFEVELKVLDYSACQPLTKGSSAYNSYVENITPLVSENITPLVSENITPLVSENITPLVSENITPLVSENITPLVSENITPLVSENITPLVSENITPLVSEA